MEDVVVIHIINSDPATKKTSQTIVTKGRPRILQSKSYRRWEKEAELVWIKPTHTRKQTPIDYEINCTALIYRRRKVGDSDNYYAAVADLLQKRRVVDNDKYIKSWNYSVLSVDKVNPRVELILTPYDSVAEYNYTLELFEKALL